ALLVYFSIFLERNNFVTEIVPIATSTPSTLSTSIIDSSYFTLVQRVCPFLQRLYPLLLQEAFAFPCLFGVDFGFEEELLGIVSSLLNCSANNWRKVRPSSIGSSSTGPSPQLFVQKSGLWLSSSLFPLQCLALRHHQARHS